MGEIVEKEKGALVPNEHVNSENELECWDKLNPIVKSFSVKHKFTAKSKTINSNMEKKYNE